MDKNIKNAEAIAQSLNTHDNKEDATMHNNNNVQSQPQTQKKHTIRDLGTKAKLTLGKIANSDFVKNARTAILAWIDALPETLSRGCLRGLLIGIALNVIASYFWPELPETIPTIYGFFNGFVTLSEFLYKVALGGIAALFNGNFMEFSDTVMIEIGELWNAFITWISAISF